MRDKFLIKEKFAPVSWAFRPAMTLVEVLLSLTLMGLLSAAMGMALYNISLSGVRSNQNLMVDHQARLAVETIQRFAQTSDFAVLYKSPAVDDRRDESDRLPQGSWGDFLVFVRLGLPQAHGGPHRIRPTSHLFCIARPNQGDTVYFYTVDVPDDEGFHSLESLLPSGELGSNAVPLAHIKPTATNPDGIVYSVSYQMFQFIFPILETYRNQTQSVICQTFVTCPNFL
jgi:type II secretory pathway pseudopilin PulG